MYRHYRGPNYYSFTWEGVHFLGLDTVDYYDLRYYGHVDALQVEWVMADVATLPTGTSTTGRFCRSIPGPAIAEDSTTLISRDRGLDETGLVDLVWS
jgi:hypothetical protein